MSKLTLAFPDGLAGIQKAGKLPKKGLFLSTELRRPFCGQGHPFREEKSCATKRQYSVAPTPTKSAFYSGERFWGLSTSRRKETRQTGYNVKMRKSAYRTSQLGEPSGKRASAFLFPFLKNIIHCHIQSRFQALLQDR